MKATNMEPVKVEEFRMDFHLDVMARLNTKVSSLGVEGLIITDQSIGHEIDIQNDYLGNSIGILGEDESEVNDELTSLYHQVAEEAEREMESRTKEAIEVETNEHRECRIVTWCGPSGWMYTFEGVTPDGLSFESEEDIGPFGSREAAIEDAEEEAAAETAAETA